MFEIWILFFGISLNFAAWNLEFLEKMRHKIIVGLGNPGQKYQSTRHNIGFLVVDRLAQEANVKFSHKPAWKTDVAKIEVEGKIVWLLKPDTFMNHSGMAVEAFLKHSEIQVIEDLLIVVDDMDLEFGQIRLKTQGGSGGHNGLKSIQAHLQTQNYPRLRMGIGRPAPEHDPSDFVLGEFLAAEREALTGFLNQACDCCRIWIRHGAVAAMESHNNNRKE